MAPAIDSEKTWKAWREGGLKVALVSLAATLIFGVVDKLTAGIIPGIADSIHDYFVPPRFSVFFSKPVVLEQKDIVLESIPRSDRRTLGIVEHADRYVVVSGPAGEYSLRLVRAERVLPAQLSFKRGESVKLDTAESQWESAATVTSAANVLRPAAAGRSGGNDVVDVRWTTSADDLAQVSRATSPAMRQILSSALLEVGVNENGTPADKERIYQYWMAIPQLAERNSITKENLGPWGATFVSWAVSRAGIKPPDMGAAFTSWREWGVAVPPDKAEPGMIALFETALPETRGRLIGGIVLRRRPQCTEIVTGNVADRVVVACVSLDAAAVRRPA